MVTRRKTEPELPKQPRRRPATTPDGRENQLIAMAVDLVEQRIRNGTASAQELVHFLRLASPREELERQRLARENELLAAKVESIASAARTEELFTNAIAAMRKYTGGGASEERDEYED